MRRTLESVAAERLNKLGKNPNIISTREDLKIDQEALKDIVAKATPNPSRSSSELELMSENGTNIGGGGGSGIIGGGGNGSSGAKRSSAGGNQSESRGETSEEGERTIVDEGDTSSSNLKKSNSFTKSRIKIIKKNLNIPNLNLLKKSPSTPSKLHSKTAITNPE